jgi:Ca2+-binding EF-hand superfamily protein
MRARTLALTGFTAVFLSTVTLITVAQTTKPADQNRDGTVSTQEKADAKARAEARWKAADTNKDGALSREELRTSNGFGNVERHFDAMDTNKDGKVTPAERRTWNQANRKSRPPASTTGTAPASGTSGSTGSSGGGGLLPPR